MARELERRLRKLEKARGQAEAGLAYIILNHGNWDSDRIYSHLGLTVTDQDKVLIVGCPTLRDGETCDDEPVLSYRYKRVFDGNSESWEVLH